MYSPSLYTHMKAMSFTLQPRFKPYNSCYLSFFRRSKHTDMMFLAIKTDLSLKWLFKIPRKTLNAYAIFRPITTILMIATSSCDAKI